jgi:diguanylate cyclase (GGDEF)-like protein
MASLRGKPIKTVFRLLRSRLSPSVARAAAVVVLLILGAVVWRPLAVVRGDRPQALAWVLFGLLSGVISWAVTRLIGVTAARDHERLERLEAEHASVRKTLAVTLESFAYAVEARTNRNTGHLARVHAYALAIARAMGLSGDVLEGVGVAALLHDIGRLGVPDNILSKKGLLTRQEDEKMRAYPVLGARLLTSIPFPWPVVPLVRHHCERYDGSGYPDGLRKNQIPLGARIVAVADAYETFASGDAVNDADRREQAMQRLEEASGTHYDPDVVAAFRQVVGGVNEQIARQQVHHDRQSSALEIHSAQREVQSLYDLACAVGSTLDLKETLNVLACKIHDIIGCSACVILLRDERGPELEARAASGVNAPFFLGSRARPGAYLTECAAARGQVLTASYMDEDLIFERAPDAFWVPLNSTLVVPLNVGGELLGTINLYHTRPDAFQSDDIRVTLFIAELAAQTIENARLFETARESAFTDELTGLKNTRFLHQFLEQEISRSRRNQRPFAVLGLDLDHFKAVNDGFGHERGDDVLAGIGRLFQSQVRQQDLVARCGGDEFIVVLPETDYRQAQTVAAKFSEATERFVEELMRGTMGFPRIGVSIGIAAFPEDGTDIQPLLAAADQNMYVTKRARRAA